MRVINMISGPRNLSTAIMYSFNNRIDCTVIDEPFYSNYLSNVNVDHPGRDDVINSQPTTVVDVVDGIFKEKKGEFVFVKNMAQHLREDLPLDFLLKMDNFFLVRHPNQLIASFAEVIHKPTMNDIGIKRSLELVRWLKLNGVEPKVLDSGDLLNDPEYVLKLLCKNLEIPYSKGMMNWPSGPKEVDGVWAKYWYKNVHSSTTFIKQKTSERELPERCKKLYAEALEYYFELKKYSII